MTQSLYWSHYWVIEESFKRQFINLEEKKELLKKLEEKYGENKCTIQ